MASFSLDQRKLSLLAAIITSGVEMAPALSSASEEDEQAIAALLAELDAIACRNGSAEITVMGDENWLEPREHNERRYPDLMRRIENLHAGTQGVITDEIDAQIEGKLADGRWDGRSSTLTNEQHLGIAGYAAHMAQKKG